MPARPRTVPAAQRRKRHRAHNRQEAPVMEQPQQQPQAQPTPEELAAANGTAEPAHVPQAAPGEPEPVNDPAELDPTAATLRMAQAANQGVGGLIARVDQLETKVLRVDRQVLVLVGITALVLWQVKAIAGKVGELETAPPSS